MRTAQRAFLMHSIWMLTVILMAAAPQVTAQSAATNPEALKERLWNGGLLELPSWLANSARPAAMGQEAAMVTEPTADVATWSRLAFQSFRDGNWEIYLAQSDGTQAKRLTYHPAVDAYPKLNRGADAIVFTSDRDGNGEIYRVSSDGANPQRLTNSPAEEAWPDWSPDSAALVFATDRHGNWDIYRMAADGSSQTRLTNSADQDVSPAWSPDGKSIAWIRHSANDSAIWLMDAEGQNQRLLQGGLRYLQNIAWSPDGTRLAFDSDVDRDYWNEIAVLQPGVGGYSIVYDANQFLVDAWMGSWSPDAQWLLFSRLEYVVQGNQLLIDRIFVDRVPWSGGPVRRILNTGYDLHPNWQTTDVIPPQARLAPLPRYVQSFGGSFEVTWSGSEIGPAGLRHYELQARRVDGGDWWIAAVTPTTEHWFQGSLGDTYAFRVRAVDNAFNTSNWSGDSWHVTTPYRWSIGGRVVDSRGVPLENAAIAADPPGVGPATSGIGGGFTVYLTEYQATRLSVQRTGYGRAAPTTFEHETSTRWWALGPTANALTNGSFEQSSLLPWQPAGSVPAIQDRTAHHAGAASALLQAAPTLSVTNLSQSPGASGFHGPPRIAVDSTGRLHALWREEDAVMYATRPPGGAWIIPEDQPRSTAGLPDMVVSPDGAVHIAFLVSEYAGVNPARHWIGYQAKAPGGAWTPVRNVSGFFPAVEYPLYVSPPVIAQDNAGGLYVTWSPGVGVWLAEKPAGRGWLPPAAINTKGRNPTMTVTSDGGLHLFWLLVSTEGGASLMESQRAPGGAWSMPQLVPTGEYNLNSRAIAADGMGNLHMILSSHGADSIGYARKPASGAWPAPAPVLDLGVRMGLSLALAASDDGYLHLTWDSIDSNNLESKVYYSLGQPDGLWTHPVLMTDTVMWERAEAPEVAPGPDHSAHVIWRQGPLSGNTEIMTTDLNVTVPHDSTLAQTVSLLADTHAATLSFAYTLAVAQDSNAVFEATVNNTPVFSTSAPTADWALGWADLSPWAGETITVAFHSRSTDSSGPVTVRLDDVTVGSWLTPVIRAIEPQPIPAGSATRLTLRGENFLPTPTVWLGSTQLGNVTWIDAATLQATIPASVKPGAYPLRVRNPSGQESAKLPFLQIGRSLHLPVVEAGR